MQAGERLMKRNEKEPFQEETATATSLSLPPPLSLFLLALFQFSSRPLGHTLESSCEGPINVKYQPERREE